MNCSLYFGVASKPKDLIEPDDLGRKAVADFDSLLVENLALTTP